MKAIDVLNSMLAHCKDCAYSKECRKGNIVITPQIGEYLAEICRLERIVEKEPSTAYKQQNYC